MWFLFGFIFCVSVTGYSDEPEPEIYIPEHVEIREWEPAGVMDEWWSRISKSLIVHVTPAYEEIPDAIHHEPFELIRSATLGFLLRWPNPPEWRPWPACAVDIKAGTGISVIKSGTTWTISRDQIDSSTQPTRIFNETAVGVVDGTNKIFNTRVPFASDTLTVSLWDQNGFLMRFPPGSYYRSDITEFRFRDSPSPYDPYTRKNRITRIVVDYDRKDQ